MWLPIRQNNKHIRRVRGRRRLLRTGRCLSIEQFEDRCLLVTFAFNCAPEFTFINYGTIKGYVELVNDDTGDSIDLTFSMSYERSQGSALPKTFNLPDTNNSYILNATQTPSLFRGTSAESLSVGTFETGPIDLFEPDGPTPQPDMIMKSVDISPDGQSVNASYTISGENISTAGTINFYWATGPTFADVIENSQLVSVPAATKIDATPYVASTSIASLGQRPQNASYIVAVADSVGTDDIHNIASAAYSSLPQIVLNSATKKDKDAVILDYSISNSHVSQALSFDIYQSAQATYDSSSILLGNTTLPSSNATDLNQGSHSITLSLSTSLSNDPTKPYIVVVADPNGSITEAPGSVNSVSANNSPPYIPAQIRTAYGINDINIPSLRGATPDGSGQTIAIVGAYDNPDIYQSLNAFDMTFGSTFSDQTLYDQYGDSTKFLTVVNQDGRFSPLPPSVRSASDYVEPLWYNFPIEEACDVEWAHAIAPGAKIILVECKTGDFTDYFDGVAAAAKIPGVSVVSMSYGSPEGNVITSLEESYYDDTIFSDSASRNSHVTFVASSGDAGSQTTYYPSTSPYVLAVGGTKLQNLNAQSDYPGTSSDGEIAWTGSGGGFSQFEKPRPSYQEGVFPLLTQRRTVPDVAFDADLALKQARF